MLTCQACTMHATFAYRWPGEGRDTQLCDACMVALSAAADPLQLDVRGLAGATLEAYPVPGEETLRWRVVRSPAPGGAQ